MPSLPKPRLRRSARARVDAARPEHTAEPRVESVQWGELRWVNIERPGPAERAWLEEHFEFHPLDYEDVLSRNQRPKIDEYEDYLFIVLYFPVFHKTVGRLNAAEFEIFSGPDYIITLPNTEIPPVEYLFERCRTHDDVREGLFSKGAGYLLYKIVDDSFDYCFPMLRKIGNKLERLEEDIFEGKAEEVVRDISNSKQEIINFRKVIRPQRAVLRDLERTKQRYLAEDLEVYFDDIVDASERIWDMLENFKEVVEALEDTNESVLSHRVNEVLRVLTAFSVIILPLTLLADLQGTPPEEQTIAVGRDMRLSAPGMAAEYARGIADEGADVIDVGMVGTEMLYWTVGSRGLDGGLMCTASHNPKAYTGAKLVKRAALALSGDSGIGELREIVTGGEPGDPVAEPGRIEHEDVADAFREAALAWIDAGAIKPMKVVLDGGNGMAGPMVGPLLESFPLERIETYWEPDGEFPDHEPNPLLEENPQFIIDKV